MKFNELFEKWNLKSIKLNIKFADLEFVPNQADEEAAWEMYVELITRITTQNLSDVDGNENEALESIYYLFSLTRDILKRYGKRCKEFSKVAIIVLNQIIRPFTSKWHQRILEKTLSREEKEEFRSELKIMQNVLRDYSKLLADMAKVEDVAAIDEE